MLLVYDQEYLQPKILFHLHLSYRLRTLKKYPVSPTGYHLERPKKMETLCEQRLNRCRFCSHKGQYHEICCLFFFIKQFLLVLIDMPRCDSKFNLILRSYSYSQSTPPVLYSSLEIRFELGNFFKLSKSHVHG